MNQQWFVVIQIPGEGSLENGDGCEGGSGKEELGYCEEKIIKDSDFIKFVHFYMDPFISLLIYPCITKCLLCLRYCGRHIGQSNEQLLGSSLQGSR